MPPTFERLVVPVAGTDDDDLVLAILPKLADRQPVLVTLLYVVEVPQSMPLDAELPDEVARGDDALGRAEATARGLLVQKGTEIYSELLQARSVGAAIVDEAIERDADAVVLAASIRRRHGRPTLNGTVQYVLAQAPCDVVLLRRAPQSSAASGAS